jgi:hypothetical protein
VAAHSDQAPRGAYGLALVGIPAEWEDLLDDADADGLEVVVEVAEGPRPTSSFFEMTAESARVSLTGGGSAQLERQPARATLLTPGGADPRVFAHSFLSACGAVFARWNSCIGLHAGGFVGADGVWAIFGEKGAGKSTTLAALAANGTDVVADDLVVVDPDLFVRRGPRAVDLRPDAALQLDFAAHETTVARDGERMRLRLPGLSPRRHRLAGWLVLQQGDRAGVSRITADSRLNVIADQFAIAGDDVNPGLVLDLCALPAWEITRRSGPNSYSETLTLVASAAGLTDVS